MSSRPFLTLFIAVFATAGGVPDIAAQGISIPLPARYGAVFDHFGHYLYISTSEGWVRPYNLSTRQLEAGYNLGGSLTSLDIAPDDSFLLVGQKNLTASQATVHRVDLPSGAATNINFGVEYPILYGVSGIAIGAHGIAMFSTAGYGPLRQIDLATNSISTRTDVPTTYGQLDGGHPMPRNAAGTYILVSGIFPGGWSIYDTEKNTFGPPTHGGGVGHGALNADGTLLANSFRFSVSLDSAKDFSLIHAFGHLGGGVAFDPIDDTLYAASIFTNDIVAYDSKTFATKFRLPVGELVDEAEPGNPRNQLVASPDGNYLALITTAGVRLFKIRPAPAASTPPTFEIPTDMVFDHAGKYLYVATYRGYVWPYNLSTGKLESPYDLGGIINGIDIAPDDSFLLAAQNYRGVNQGSFQKVDLHNGAITHLTYDLPWNSSAHGSWDVAIASNAKAFGTTFTNGSADNPLQQIDLATNSINVRQDAPTSGSVLGLGTQIHRSANRNRLVFMDSRGADGPLFTYDAVNDNFGPVVYQGKYWGQTSAAVDRNGNLMAWAFDTTGAHLQTLPSFSQTNYFPGLDSGVAFDATRDVLYGVGGQFRKQIVGYDTNTFAESFRMDIGEYVSDTYEQFGVGNLVASQDGRYLAVVTPTTMRVLDVVTKTVAALPTPTPPPEPPGRLGNISTRTFTGTADNVPIGGFIINGTSPKKVILRAMGPTLAFFGVPGALDDPTLELHDQAGSVIAFNDNWRNSPNWAEILAARLFPSFEREAAILATLDPGAYTAVLRGKNQLTGVALIEIYDVDPTSNSTLGNISTRGFVGSNDNVMIGGLVISDSATKVFVRGIGPSLEQFGVTGVLQDPIIELHNGNGVVMAFNDDWREPYETEIWNAGGPLSNDRESALVLTLLPGSYTAILRGKDNSTGNGLVEVYRLQ